MKVLIKNSEERYINYSSLLENLYKSKSDYKPEELNYLRTLYKEFRDIEEKHLKSLVLEQTFINGGLDYPFLYKNKNIKQ